MWVGASKKLHAISHCNVLITMVKEISEAKNVSTLFGGSPAWPILAIFHIANAFLS